MARRIVWTATALQERKEILLYWVQRNKSKVHSSKLNFMIEAALKDLTTNPLIGRTTDVPAVRVKIVKTYLIFYKIFPKKHYSNFNLGWQA